MGKYTVASFAGFLFTMLVVAQFGVGLVAAAPTVPPPISPANGAAINDATPTFSWASVPGAASYTLEYALDAGFTTGKVAKSGLTDNSYTVPGSQPLADNKYYWHVRAVDNLGKFSSWSATWSFTVDTVVAAPVLDTPPAETNEYRWLATGSTEAHANVRFYLGETLCSETATANENGRFSAWIILVEGRNVITAVATDVAGNRSRASSPKVVWYRPEMRKAEKENLSAGDHTFDFTEVYPVQLIDRVVLRVGGTVPEAIVLVEALKEKPAEVPLVSGVLYGFTRISIQAPAGNIESAEAEFRVRKNWIVQKNLDESTIKLLEYNESGGVWEPLPTTKVGEDGTYAHFSAKLQGFSVFAISGEVQSPEPEMSLWPIVLGAIVVVVVIFIIWPLVHERRAPKEEGLGPEKAEEAPLEQKPPPEEKAPQKEELPKEEKGDF